MSIPSPDDPGFLAKFATAAAGAAGTIVAAVWTTLNKRIGKVEKQVEEKADQAEMERQRDNIGKLFDSMKTVEVNVASINAQMGRFISDIESEKETRREANKAINEKLDRIMERRQRPRDGRNV